MSFIPTRFPCGDITLEGGWNLPEGEGPFPGVVVCHPYPPMGGNMLNNVVSAICQELAGHKIAAFRFNFRGVGGSEGSFDDGIAEQEDVKAALDFVLASPDIDGENIGLAGYSFGARVSLPVALQDEKVCRLALISPPLLPDDGWEKLELYDKPKLFIAGGADDMIPLEQFREYMGDCADTEYYQVIPGVDHFWRGSEEELAGRVTRFFAAGFGG